MRTRRLRFMALMAVGLVVGWVGLAAATGVSGPSKAAACEAAKLEATGEKAECLLEEAADAVLGKTSHFAKCSAKFTQAFAKAEAKAGAGICLTNGDAAAIEAQVDASAAAITTLLSGGTLPPSHQCPATGQTTCYDSSGGVITCTPTSGQDGNIQAGATLSYTDNGDGTITDNNTGLMWEKKSSYGDIHNWNTSYTWANAFAVHIAGLNAGSGFAGHTDWRLPNVKELQSIVNYGTFNPAVSSEFNNCFFGSTVLTGSCTQASSYWSSTSYAKAPASAWYVDFFDGNVNAITKSTDSFFVRAVRGGL